MSSYMSLCAENLFCFLTSALMESACRTKLLRKIGIKSHFLRALSHDNDVKSHLNGQRVNPYDIIFPHAQYYDAHKTNEKIRFFDAAAAAATTYCYPNKTTQNLISLEQNPEWLPKYV